MLKLVIKTFLFFFVTTSSYGYLGPGIGGGALAATLGFIIAILAAVFGLIWFPIKKFINKKKIKKNKLT